MYKIGFIGLGKIGYNLAGSLSKKYKTYVWNRTIQKSLNHNKEFCTYLIDKITNICKCNVIFFCLPKRLIWFCPNKIYINKTILY